MLLPLHDENPLRHIRFQYATVAVIAVCVGVFLYQATLSPEEGQAFVFRYGTIPAVLFGERELAPRLAAVPAWVTVLTSMFLHGGWLHLIGNMLFLWVVGDNVEDSMGHVRFIAFYLACGVIATLAHGVTDTGSVVPMVGASGAISGVIGAYLVLHPRASIHTLVVRFVVALPAYVVLGLWALLQAVNAIGSLGAPGGVAWWAHVGGFVAGVVLIVPLRRKGVPLLDRTRTPRRAPRRRSVVPDTRRRR